MRFEDVFPYDREKFSFIIKFFNKYTESRNFPREFEYLARGGGLRFHEFAAVHVPAGDDADMLKGPTVWEGDPDFAVEEYVLDFHEFAVIILIAASVFLINMRDKGITEYSRWINLVDNSEHIHTEEGFIRDVKLFREKFLDVDWIKKNCYGEADIIDNEGIWTGDRHDARWEEEWYEKYGRDLNFDDVDDIVNSALGKVGAICPFPW